MDTVILRLPWLGQGGSLIIYHDGFYMDQADDSLESLELRAKESRTLIS